MSARIIIFDFDGTIADTYDAFVSIINRLADKFGYQQVGEEELKRLRNLNSQEIIKQSQISIFKVPALLKRAKKEMAVEINHIQPIEGIISVLWELKKSGFKLGILTSNTQENVGVFLKNHQLQEMFDFVYSGTTIFGKDRILNKLIKKYNLMPEKIIYVGDETRDIEAAKKSLVNMIAVSWGFNSPDILAKHQPNFLITNPNQLQEVIKLLDS